MKLPVVGGVVPEGNTPLNAPLSALPTESCTVFNTTIW